MKLVEIKNSLARLHYEPSDFPLVLSDFLTIDDGNQKIIAQAISIESTNIDVTNCALLNFVLDLNSDGTFNTYNGYVPALDALVSKTKPTIIQQIFSGQENSINIGKITNSSNVDINIKSSLTENFLYIQSDRYDDTQNIIKKLINFNKEYNKKTLLLDFEGLNNYTEGKTLQVGLDFKIPITNNVLNYIYEHDLSGLNIEQKVIVQDIILDIQEYINSLDEQFIPFKTLLKVINDIYQTDKSIGIILFRNKLLKYNQLNIFATNKEEFLSLNDSLSNNLLTVINLNSINEKWQREYVKFVISCIDTDTHLVFDIKDEALDSDILNTIYKSNKIKPIISSKYDSLFATQLKSFAKNLILFKPLLQQKAFATYNSFFEKINQNECIISGEATYFTPLIVKELSNKFQFNESTSICDNKKTYINKTEINNIQQESLNLELAEAITEGLTESTEEFEIIDNEELIELTQEDEEYQTLDSEQTKEISLETEIAKDVDKMFYAENTENISISEETEKEKEEIEEDYTTNKESNIDYDEMFKDVDMDLLDELNVEDENTNISNIDNDIINLNDLTDDDDDDEHFIIEESDNKEYQEEISFIQHDTPIEEEYSKLTNKTDLPIYSTDIVKEDEKDTTEENNINIAEGNIVYHEKYGRGVVEQIIEYGKKSLCSIQFDNVGRRLLDPTLADLKQI